MKYIVATEKNLEQACKDLEAAVQRNKFGILHVHDLKATMNKKGVAFDNECRVFEVCNPQKAQAVLAQDMALNMVLPCRISIWQENGQVKIGTLKPSTLLAMLSESPALQHEAAEVEETLLKIINESK